MIRQPPDGDPYMTEMVTILNAELTRRESMVTGVRHDGDKLYGRFRAPIAIPFVQVHVQSTVTGKGGVVAYDPVNFESSVEVDCRASRQQDLTVTIVDGERYAVFLIPIQEDQAGTKVLYDGQGGRPDNMSVVGDTRTALDGIVRDKGGAVFNVQHPQFGAVGDGVADDTVAIQAALDAAAADSAAISECLIPAGNYVISNTLFIPEGVTFRGVGATEAAGQKVTRISLATGTDKDMIRLKPHFTAGNYWWFGHIHSLALFGDTAGSVGNGISFRDLSGNLIIAQDQTTIHDVIVRGCSENALHFPKGATPAHVSDCKLIFNGGYGVRFTSLSGVTNKFAMSIHFANISLDGNISGGMLFEECDDWSNIVLTHIRGEKRTNSDRGSVTAQEDLLIFDNCALTAVSIHGMHVISSVVDGGASSGFEAPSAAIKIQGEGAPIVKWAGATVRLRDGDSNAANCVMLNDTVLGRTVSIERLHGEYNSLAVVRNSRDLASIADRAGLGTSIASTYLAGIPSIAFGDAVVSALSIDLAGLSKGEAYVQAADTVFTRFENATGGAIDLGSASFDIAKVPDSMFKAQAAVTWDPANTADGALVSVTVTVPSALGDLVMFSHATNLKSTLGTSYASAADTITVQLQNESGSAQNVDSATLTVYVFKDEAFIYMNAVAFNPSSLADQVGETTTISVPGARLGDFVVASFSLDLQNIIMSPYVSANDVVSVRFQNETGGVLNLGAGTLKVGIINVHAA